MSQDVFKAVEPFTPVAGKTGRLYALHRLEAAGLGKISRLPVSIRIVLESVLRNCDSKKVTEEHVRRLAAWQPNAPRTDEIPFVVSRVLLQDFTGVPLLADLAAMRGVARRLGKDPKLIEPLVPVHMAVDHSVQIDHYGTPDALRRNMELEFRRNAERYRFMKWGMQAFDTFKVIPPGIGICHQINLEYLAKGVLQKDGVYYPDTLVGTDSHTTMINGLGIVGWGVGGIEAEAGMLGQPVYMLTPDVVGVALSGKLRPGVTATDLVLTVTELLRKAKVVGKFVEFFGDGAASLAATDRATVANMAPEYGATMGYFPPDEETAAYFAATGRTDEEVAAFRSYFQAQGLFGMPRPGDCDYSTVIELDLGGVVPSVSGPKRPQDRIELPDLKGRFTELFQRPIAEGGYNKPLAALGSRVRTQMGLPSGAAPEVVRSGADQAEESVPSSHGPTSVKNTSIDTEVEMVDNHPTPDTVRRTAADAPARTVDVGHGDILIAAITSCTNTSNPGVLLAAGLLAKKAVERGLSVRPHVKTSLSPGSRVVTEYLRSAGLLPYLEQLGFGVAIYGCGACVGNVGPLDPKLEEAVVQNDLVCCAVLSGNRNFEARVHGSIRANFLASPPLVVAFAIAGRADIDLTSEPLGTGSDGRKVLLRDIWPSREEIGPLLKHATDPETFRRLYADFTKDHDLWNDIPAAAGDVYGWPTSTYAAEPPFFAGFGLTAEKPGDVRGARVLAILGDSVTTDHISPAGSIRAASPAGKWLQANGVAPSDFNTYGARRGNHEVMMRGTFANVRLRNLMIPANADGSRVEGGFTIHQPTGDRTSIYDAATKYLSSGVPTVIFGGEEYGSGSSRDWAAKGTQLLGVRAVIARSFERIHRSNLVGMGVLPLQFKGADSAKSLALDGSEECDLTGIAGEIRPGQEVTLTVRRKDGSQRDVPLLLRIDTAIEADYYRHGGILPFVLRELLAA